MEDRHFEPVLLIIATIIGEKLVADDLVPKYVPRLSLDVACREGISEWVGESDHNKISILGIILEIEAFQVAIVPPARVASHPRTIHFEPILMDCLGTNRQTTNSHHTANNQQDFYHNYGNYNDPQIVKVILLI